MARAARSLVGALACALGAAGAGPLDEVALVQRSAAQAVAPEAAKAGPLRMTGQGPVAETKTGPVLGVEEDKCLSFRGIPYAEPPRRFEKAQPKQPWAPHLLSGKVYGPGCVGSSTSKVETEDCLHLNIWLPKGGRSGLPVIVYFHGGLNMHGSGSELFRQGDGVTLSPKFPVIFVNLDYRLGLLGWISQENATKNLGLRDQQMALQWLHENIAAFGGDPNQVALMGQSEGSGNIKAHLVSPGSAGLFHRAIFHSPPADIWSGNVNKVRSQSMVMKLGCKGSNPLACLRKVPAARLWHADWSPEDMSRNPGSPTWFSGVKNTLLFASEGHLMDIPTFLGYHPEVDGDVVPGEIIDLIAQGRWNKVPILLTVSRNETHGVIPATAHDVGMNTLLQHLLRLFFKAGDGDRVIDEYNATLRESGITGTTAFDLLFQMFTDRLWTCDAWSFAKEVARGGGSIQLGGFWHAPHYDPIGMSTNAVCTQGATCHAAEMLYSLPQGRGAGIPVFMPKELAFMHTYRDNVLSFVYGQQGPWEPYRLDRQVITFVDEHGARPEVGYRQKQCAVLDSSVADTLPEFMRRRMTGQ